ncbi:hypothetical protein MBLNU459_g3078t1 [Dothideomycetes sp. NU459]
MTIKICQEINNDYISNVPKENATTSIRIAIAEESSALCYALLMATAAVGRTATHRVTRFEKEWLEFKTVQTLNKSIADPATAFQNSTILAVSLVALYESSQGDASIASWIHQPALRRMVDMRGGLSALLPCNSNGMHVVRNLIWQDRIIHLRTGNPLMFGDYVDPSMAELEWDKAAEEKWNSYWLDVMRSHSR